MCGLQGLALVSNEFRISWENLGNKYFLKILTDTFSINCCLIIGLCVFIGMYVGSLRVLV